VDRLGGGLWGGVVAPLGLGYLGFLMMLFVYSRSGVRERRGPGRPAAWSGLLRYLVTTSVAGFLIFLAIVLVFSFMFADEEQAIRQALTGGAFIGFIGLVGLAFLGWIEAQLRRPPRRPDSPIDRRSG
jgi:Na+/proline symporter